MREDTMDEKKGMTLQECVELFAMADAACYRLGRELAAVSPEKNATVERLGALIRQKGLLEDLAMRREAHAAYLAGRAEATEEHVAYMADAEQVSEHREVAKEQYERIIAGNERIVAAMEGILAILKERLKP